LAKYKDILQLQLSITYSYKTGL